MAARPAIDLTEERQEWQRGLLRHSSHCAVDCAARASAGGRGGGVPHFIHVPGHGPRIISSAFPVLPTTGVAAAQASRKIRCDFGLIALASKMSTWYSKSSGVMMGLSWLLDYSVVQAPWHW